MLSSLDYVVLVAYFVFIVSLGWFYRHAAKDSSDYFRGGGGMPWWLVGGSVFISSFSAWTFTAAAGVAFDGGLVVLTIYWANALGMFITAWWFAGRFRQTRAITMIEALRQRLGTTNQQLLLWLGLPMGILRAAIWLYGLAVFLSPVFGLDVTTVIVVAGIVVVVVSTLGGSWAVVTSDFMQTLMLLPITVLAGWYAVREVGGLQPLMAALPADHFDLTASSLPAFGVIWLIALLIEKIVLANALNSAGRFLCVVDSREARWSAAFAGVLFLLGSVIWFLPPLAARALNLDLATLYPGIAKPAETAYAAMVVRTLPPGLLGLMVTGLIAATLSSMDSGLNSNAGTFVRGVYHPLLRPRALERELVLAGRAATMIMGSAIVLLALEYSSWRNVGVFTLMFNLSAMLGAPSSVPCFWAVLTRRTADWGLWATMLVGFANSALLGWLPRQDWARDAFARHGWSDAAAWLTAHEYGVIMITNLVFCSAFYLLSGRFARPVAPHRQTEVDAFFAAVETPVVRSPDQSNGSAQTARSVGRMCLIYGAFIAVIGLIPNTARGHTGLLLCAAFFFCIHFVLRGVARRSTATPHAAP